MNNNISFPVLKLKQPIGEFFVGAISAKDLLKISYADIRGIEDNNKEAVVYTGIQRTLSKSRVKELKEYVRTADATFPTSVVIAVEGQCTEYDEDTGMMTLTEYIDDVDLDQSIPLDKIAKIIDGQHRLAGLDDTDVDFEINLTVFVDIDVAEQANIFSTVNLAQTKVNKSLVYDLFEYQKSRSPQKTCHNIAVALDESKQSPFYEKIKRLGVATKGRAGETLTQATFVKALLPFITSRKGEISDRDTLLRGVELPLVGAEELKKRIFRNYFIKKKDLEIGKIIWEYFDAVRERWPEAWNKNPDVEEDRGYMLNKTNGFKALMKFLRLVYLSCEHKEESFKKYALNILKKSSLEDSDFVVDKFKPGSSGESALWQALQEQTGLTVDLLK